MVLPAVAMRGVDLSLGRGAARVHILRDVSLTIGKGEAVGIVGASGSGKSTLLMIMAGLERPDKGEVEIDGVRLGAMNEDALARFRGQRIGIVFQSFHLIPTMTALENVAAPLELAGAGDATATRARRARAGGPWRPAQSLSGAAFGRRAAARRACSRALPAPVALDRRRADRQSRRGDRPRDYRLPVRFARAAWSDAGARHPRRRARRPLRPRDPHALGQGRGNGRCPHFRMNAPAAFPRGSRPGADGRASPFATCAAGSRACASFSFASRSA